MRIALITRRFDPMGGGTERDLMVTARYLARAGHQLSFYAGEVRADSSEWPVRKVGLALPVRSLALLSFALSASEAARADGAELVLSFARVADPDVMRSGGSAHSSYLAAMRKWRGPLGRLSSRLSPYHRVQILTERLGFASRRLKKTIAVSDFVRRDLIDTFKLDPRDVVTLYNGVDLDRFKPCLDPNERLRARDQFKLPPSARVVAFVGNGFARKGLEFLIRAWPSLPSDAYLLVAGADRQMSHYQKLARQLEVAARVRFLGPNQKIERVFEAADGLALPSLFEPFGNVAMEAMAAGLPVMTSVFCGVAEVAPESMRRFVVNDPTDPNEIAGKLSELLEAPADFRTTARATAERFTWDRYGDELAQILSTF